MTAHFAVLMPVWCHWSRRSALGPKYPAGRRAVRAVRARVCRRVALRRRRFATGADGTAPHRARPPLVQAKSDARAASVPAEIELSRFTPDLIRNFSIIAHVDHGKSTLADRLLELTGTIPKSRANKQVMDRLQVEQERGITVKAQTASLSFWHHGAEHLINLIDTPGHVDFGYEVSCSLSACQGSLLVVDASQGVQAQTIANFWLAFERDLAIIPVINKVDLPGAEPDRVAEEMKGVFDIAEDDLILVSAKTGLGVDKLLPAVIDRIPPPAGGQPDCKTDRAAPLKALLFDSWYDPYRGVINMIEVLSGTIRSGDKICFAASGLNYDVFEVGVLHPGQVRATELFPGQVGYMISGMKRTSEARVGDTIYRKGFQVEPLPGFKPARCMVFAGIYPVNQGDYESLVAAIEKLHLNDASVTIRKEISHALGPGWRIGFLGMLHMDVFCQRLEQEYDLETIVTAPSVSYRTVAADGTVSVLENPSDFPTNAKNLVQKIRKNSTVLALSVCPRVAAQEIHEPMVEGTLVFPERYMGRMISLCQDRRGVQQSIEFMTADRVIMKYRLPLNEIVEDFYDELKGASSGFASFDYEDQGYEPSDMVLLPITLNGDVVEALTTIVHNSRAFERGKSVCARLKSVISRQLYDVAIQASVKGRVIARETVKAVRKDVTAKCYGGDISRKKKLLQKQKAGKKKMRMIGTVEVPKEAFLSIMKK